MRQYILFKGLIDVEGMREGFREGRKGRQSEQPGCQFALFHSFFYRTVSKEV
jgi:hypothetical protein